MNPQDVQAVIGIASSLTTNAVLLMWLWREMKQADIARNRLQMMHDKTREELQRAREESGKGA